MSSRSTSQRVHVPALLAVGQLVGLDRALGELVLVLLVVLDRQEPPADDRGGHHARDLGVVALRGRDLKALLGRVLAERVDDLLARAGEGALGQVLADQVDRRHQRLGLEREQAGGAREVVAVGLGVDLDLVALHLGVEHVGAAAEVHDVEHVDVLAQLGVGHLERGAQLRQLELAALASGIDQDAGERDQPREALGPNRRVAPVVVLLALRGAALARRLGELGRLRVALDHELEALAGLGRELVRTLDARLLAQAEHPGEHLARVRVVGLEGHAAALRLGHLAGVTEVAQGEPVDAVREVDAGAAGESPSCQSVRVA